MRFSNTRIWAKSAMTRQIIIIQICQKKYFVASYPGSFDLYCMKTHNQLIISKFFFLEIIKKFIIKIFKIFLLLHFFQIFLLGISTASPTIAVQVTLCQKHSFLHQLTQSMTTDCSWITSSVQENYMFRTHCVQFSCKV